jgi:hypothetical protein
VRNEESSKTAKPAKPRVIGLEPVDLHIICACRRISMVIRGAKADLRKPGEIYTTMRLAMELCCGCKSMLANTGGVKND